MKISASRRRALLLVVALALVAAAMLDSADEPRVAVSAAAGPRAAPQPAKGAAISLPEIPLAKLDEPISRDPVGDAFEVRSWEPPPAPPRKIVPPPPQAPPLPYTYMGKIMEGSAAIVFLAKQDRNYAVRQGETIDGTYRIDDIKQGTMMITYLPLDQKQILAIGTAD